MLLLLIASQAINVDATGHGVTSPGAAIPMDRVVTGKCVGCKGGCYFLTREVKNGQLGKTGVARGNIERYCGAGVKGIGVVWFQGQCVRQSVGWGQDGGDRALPAHLTMSTEIGAITADFTGIDLFLNSDLISKEECIPKTKFSNPLKTIYYHFLLRLDPYSVESVNKLLNKFKNNVNIIKGNSNLILKKINLDTIDYVLLDGGHKYETVKADLQNLTPVINNLGTILCDDYNLSYAPGVKKAIDEYVLTKNFNLKILQTRFAEITKKN